MPTNLRQLVSKDVDLFRQLLAVFAAAFEDAESYLNHPPSDDYLAGLLENATFMAIIALQDDAVIGGLTAYELKKYERERSEIYIYDLAVAQDHRRQGIATDLINAAKTIAFERNAYTVFVQADYTDPPAIALYTKLSVREDVLHFDIAPT